MKLELKCQFIEQCPDIKRLRENQGDEELNEQYDELCSFGGYSCSIREGYLEKEREKE